MLLKAVYEGWGAYKINEHGLSERGKHFARKDKSLKNKLINLHTLKQRKKTTFSGETSRLRAQTNGPTLFDRHQVGIGHFQVACETKSVSSPKCAFVIG